MNARESRKWPTLNVNLGLKIAHDGGLGVCLLVKSSRGASVLLCPESIDILQSINASKGMPRADYFESGRGRLGS